jgi:hypothetical protein
MIYIYFFQENKSIHYIDIQIRQSCNPLSFAFSIIGAQNLDFCLNALLIKLKKHFLNCSSISGLATLDVTTFFDSCHILKKLVGQQRGY